MNVFDTREDFKVTGVEVNALSNIGDDALSSTGGAVERKPHPNQMIGYILNLYFNFSFLHGNDHNFLVVNVRFDFGIVRLIGQVRFGSDLLTLYLSHDVNDALKNS